MEYDCTVFSVLCLPLLVSGYGQLDYMIFDGDFGDDAESSAADAKICEFDGVLTKKTLTNLTDSSCTSTTGSITVDETCDLSTTEIKNMFTNLPEFEGPVIVVNTSYEHIDVFEFFNPKWFQKIDYVLLVANNSKARSLDWEIPAAGTIWVLDNPQLDLSDNCPTFEYYFFQRTLTRGNKKNCECELFSAATEEALSELPDDCDSLSGNLTLIGENIASYETLKAKFGKLKVIKGQVVIDSTSLPDLNFLSSLKTARWRENIVPSQVDRVFFQIENNANLKSFDWSTLEIKELTISIRNNSQLCVTSTQITTLLTNGVVKAAEFTLCKDAPLGPDHIRIPAEGFSGLPDKVTVIVGDIIVNETTDISQMWKLDYVTTVLGNIIIQNNSELVTTNHLWKLVMVIPVEEPKLGIVITNNTRMRTVHFQEDLRVFSGVLTIDENPKVAISNASCETMSETNTISVTNNKGNCIPDYVPLVTTNSAQRAFLILSVLLGLSGLLPN